MHRQMQLLCRSGDRDVLECHQITVCLVVQSHCELTGTFVMTSYMKARESMEGA